MSANPSLRADGLPVDCLFAGGHRWDDAKTVCLACGQVFPQKRTEVGPVERGPDGEFYLEIRRG